MLLTSKKPFRTVVEKLRPSSKKEILKKTQLANTLAKQELKSGNDKSSRQLYELKRELLRHNILCLYPSLRAAKDNPFHILVDRFHFIRNNKYAFVKYERLLLQLGRKLEHLLTQVSLENLRVNFRPALNLCDRLAVNFNMRSVELHMRNAKVYVADSAHRAAIFELRTAFAQLRKVAFEAANTPASPQERQELRCALDQVENEIVNDKSTTIPALVEVFGSLDGWPRITRDIIVPLRRLQHVSRLTRVESQYDRARDQLDLIAKDMLGGYHPPSGLGIGPVFATPLQVEGRCPFISLPKPQRQKKRPRVRIGIAPSIVLGMKEIKKQNAVGMFSNEIRKVESLGASVVLPWASVSPERLGSVGIAYVAQQEHHEAIKEIAKTDDRCLAKVHEIICSNPAIIVVAPDQYQGVTSDLARSFAGIGCDILLTASGFNARTIPSGKVSTGYSFSCLVSRPQGVSTSKVADSIQPLMKRRGGSLLLTENVAETLLQDNLFDRSLIYREFMGNNEKSQTSSNYKSNPNNDEYFGRFILQRSSRPGMLASVIGALERMEARIVTPLGYVGENQRGVVDILYLGSRNIHWRVEQYAKSHSSGTTVECGPIPCSIPFGIVISVRDHNHLTYDVTQVLARHGCDLIQAMSSFDPWIDPHSQDIRINRSFSGIAARGLTCDMHKVYAEIDAIARKRGGVARLADDCSGMFLKSIVPPAFHDIKRGRSPHWINNFETFNSALRPKSAR